MAGIGSAPGIILGVGVGAATSAALAPAIEVPKQDAWASAPHRILDAATLARLVAQGGISLAAAHADGARDGYAADKIDALTYLSQTVPGVGIATDLWRKGLLSDTLYTHSLNKSGLDERYVAPIVAAKTAEIVGIGDLAYGVVRGILPSPSWVPVPPPTSGTSVPRFPQVQLDPIVEAARLGYDEQMFQLMVGRSGLSLAPGLAAQAYFRGLINAADYTLAIAEGDLRTEWAQTLRETSRQIPTTLDYTEAHLRGWISQQAMYDGAARHGTSQADTQLMYEVRRRPLSVPTITKALARGGTFDAAQAPFTDPYVASVHEANLGPEWYDLAEHMKYTYPSAFVLRALLKDGAIAAAEASQIMQYEGYPPALADKIAAAYAPTGAAAADPHVGKAQTQLWTTTHKSYVGEMIDGSTATTALTAAGVTAAAVQPILTLWNEERSLVRKQLTPAQIKKAWSEGVTNPATGAAWTEAEAIAALEARGYDQADATVLLSE